MWCVLQSHGCVSAAAVCEVERLHEELLAIVGSPALKRARVPSVQGSWNLI